MSTSATIYITALKYISASDFETVCRKIIEYKWNSSGLRFPSNHAGGDGGNDAWDLTYKRKYAFSIQRDWKAKIESELEKLATYNNQSKDHLLEIYYLTNQDISTKESNNFISKIKTSASISIFSLQELASICEQYLQENDDPGFYNILGIAEIISSTKNSNSYGLPNLDTWNESEDFEKNILVSENSTEFLLSNKKNLADLFFENIDHDVHKHYLIMADAGMGKSYEIERTISLIFQNNKNENNKHKKISAYFYNLKTFSGNFEWNNHSPNVNTKHYVFLDGWDELSINNQYTVKKHIEETLNNKPLTYFVISGRSGSFDAVRLEQSLKNYIKGYIALPNNIYSEFSGHPLYLSIPFFKNLSSSMESEPTSTASQLMEVWFEKEWAKHCEKNSLPKSLREKTNHQKILSKIGKFAYSLFKESRNDFSEQELVELDETLENILAEESWISRDPKDITHFCFKHKIFQEYLIALYIYTDIQDPFLEFCTGFEKSLIKKTHSNIFYLWLDIVSQSKEVKKIEQNEIRIRALNLAKETQNIPLLLSCDYSYIEGKTRVEIVQTVLDKFYEINFTYSDIGKISLWIKSLGESEQKSITIMLYKSILDLSISYNSQDGKLEIFTSILLNIIKNKKNIIDKSDILALLHKIFDLYTAGTQRLKPTLSNINEILCCLDSSFKIDREFEEYYKDNKEILKQYLSDFKVFYVVETFMTEIGTTRDFNSVFLQYKDQLLSILPLLEISNFNGGISYGDTTQDDEYTPILEIGMSLKDIYNITILFDSVLKQDSPSDELLNFIFEAFIILFKKYHNKGYYILVNNKLYELILSQAHQLFTKNLSGDQHKILRGIFTPDQVLKIDYYWDSYIYNIIDTAPPKEKKEWLNLYLSYYLNNNNPSKCVDHIISRTLDFSDKPEVEKILSNIKASKRVSSLKLLDYKFSSILDTYYHRNNGDISPKWKSEYTKIFEERDNQEQQFEKDKEELLQKSNEHQKEIEVLFDYSLFKKELESIVNLAEELKIADWYLFIESYLSQRLSVYNDSDSQEYLNAKKILEKFPNQILVSFLWRYWNGFNRTRLETLKKEDWERIRLICISDIIGEISTYGNTIDFKGVEYFKQKNNDIKNEKHKLLKARFSEIIKEPFHYQQDIHHKINILLWLTLNGIKVDFPEEYIPLYLDYPTLRMWGHPLSCNPYLPLEILIGSNQIILKVCKQQILESPITKMHWWQFYIAYLRQYLSKEDCDLLQITIRIKSILDIAIDENWSSVEGIKSEYIAFQKEFEIPLDDSIKIFTPDDVSTFFRHQKSIPNNIQNLIKKKFQQSESNIEKYKYGLYAVDGDSEIARWLINYWLEGGDVPRQFLLSDLYPSALAAKFNIDDELLSLLCKLLAYSCEDDKLSTRREALLIISQNWIANSIKTQDQFLELRKTVNTIVASSVRFKYLKTIWLRDIEEACSS
ncbi:MAG: NACHT domain-containing protein [Brevinema sp.]